MRLVAQWVEWILRYFRGMKLDKAYGWRLKVKAIANRHWKDFDRMKLG
jgi:hypothetical protein